MKKILGVYSAPQQHWVGDGFPVRSLFSYHGMGEVPGDALSPFLLLDYAGPEHFLPTDHPRGVGEHPHRGFETVTIVYDGEVAHRDSTGAGGTVGPGDVQWMTAGAGILHEEFHSPEFTKNGGNLEMVQLWVNLPAQDKMSEPGYQTLLNQDIPRVELAGDAGYLRVIAGEFNHQPGPARTFSPVNVWDVRLKKGHTSEFEVPEGHTVAVIVLKGGVLVNGGSATTSATAANAHAAQLVLFDRSGHTIVLAGDVQAEEDATVLVLTGEPLNEPVVGHGPFVMNSEREIGEAISDFRYGNFGRMRR